MATTQVPLAAPAPTTHAEHRATFFRQSGWLMVAGVMAGALMWGVHFFSKVMPSKDYGTMGVLLSVVMCVPTMPLQMVFAQQTAAALATQRQRQLVGMIRAAWLGTFLLWAAGAAVLFFFQGPIMARWQISNPAALWAMALAVLGSMWVPMFSGLMQGEQNFLWLGWGGIAQGIGRFGCVAVATLVLHSYVTGIMAAVAIGLLVNVIIGIWQTASLWKGPAESFDRGILLRQIVPLMLGFGAYQFLFASDTTFVKTYLPDQTEYYFAAGTLSRALVWLIGPLTAVMFPKIVHSTARGEKSNLMGLTLLCTAALTVAGVLGLWVLGPLVVKLVYKPEYVAPVTAVLPWYAAVMLPLSLASVLAYNLLAKCDFRVVVPMLALAAAYGIALSHIHSSLIAVLQTFGTFNLILFGVCAWFTWGRGARRPEALA
jgi:O-antigen/teichoic acid export membrane protein